MLQMQCNRRGMETVRNSQTATIYMLIQSKGIPKSLPSGVISSTTNDQDEVGWMRVENGVVYFSRTGAHTPL